MGHKVASWGKPLPPEQDENAEANVAAEQGTPIGHRIAEIRERLVQAGLVDLRDELLVILADLMLEVLADVEPEEKTDDGGL